MKAKKIVLPIVSFILAIMLGALFVVFAASKSNVQSGTTQLDALIKNGFFEKHEPNDNVLRGDMIKSLIRIFVLDSEATGGTYENGYSDVTKADAPYILYAVEKGYIKGISGTEFGTESPLFLTDALSVILRMTGENITDETDVTALAKTVGLYSADEGDLLFYYVSYSQFSEMVWNLLSLKINNSQNTYAENLIYYSKLDSTDYESLCGIVDAEYSFGDSHNVLTCGFEMTTEIVSTSVTESEKVTTEAQDTFETEEESGWGPIWRP